MAADFCQGPQRKPESSRRGAEGRLPGAQRLAFVAALRGFYILGPEARNASREPGRALRTVGGRAPRREKTEKRPRIGHFSGTGSGDFAKKMLKMKDPPGMSMKTKDGMTKRPAKYMAFSTKMHESWAS